MLVDWFTVGAQVLNFVILVWLMKRFLYRPILDAIDAREKRIAASLADAAAKMAQAQSERDDFQRKNDELDRQRDSLLSQAAEDADAERRRLVEQARQAADALAAKRQEALRADAQRLSRDLARRTQDEVFAITRKALSDLATTSLEASATDVFVRRLRSLSGNNKDQMAGALARADEPVRVRSAFDLPQEQRAAIRSAVDEVFRPGIELRFETAPELVGGIELSANGQKLAWSIAEYLASMQQAVDGLLVPASSPDAAAAAR